MKYVGLYSNRTLKPYNFYIEVIVLQYTRNYFYLLLQSNFKTEGM